MKSDRQTLGKLITRYLESHDDIVSTDIYRRFESELKVITGFKGKNLNNDPEKEALIHEAIVEILVFRKDRLTNYSNQSDIYIKGYLKLVYDDVKRNKRRHKDPARTNLRNRLNDIALKNPDLITRELDLFGLPSFPNETRIIWYYNEIPIIEFDPPIIKETAIKVFWKTAGLLQALLEILKLTTQWIHIDALTDYFYNSSYDRIKDLKPITEKDPSGESTKLIAIEQIGGEGILKKFQQNKIMAVAMAIRKLLTDNKEIYYLFFIRYCDKLNKSNIKKLLHWGEKNYKHADNEILQIFIKAKNNLSISDKNYFKLVLYMITVLMLKEHPSKDSITSDEKYNHIRACNFCQLRKEHYNRG